MEGSLKNCPCSEKNTNYFSGRGYSWLFSGMVEPVVLTSKRYQKDGSKTAKKGHLLTEAGKECLLRWIKTLSIQGSIIGNFIEKVSELDIGSGRVYG